MSSVSPSIVSLFRRNNSVDLRAAHDLSVDTAHIKLQRAIVHISAAVLLLAIAYLAHFSQSRNIGFYSDDQTFSVRPLSWSPQQFRFWLIHQTISYPEPQGRPLGFAFGILFAYLGDRLDGIDGMFIVGWWILSLNAILFYHLLRRCFSQPIPLIGAISFLLFPADTTRPFLCHAHILQPSLTFMLIAGHLYLGGSKWRRVLAYFMATLCLITYESAMLPFIAIPLLETARDAGWRRRFARHIVTVFLIFAFIGLTRKIGHEYRTEEISGGKTTVILDIFAGSFIGPAAAVFAYGLRFWSAIRHLWFNPINLLAMLAISAVFAAALWLTKGRRQDTDHLRDDAKRAIQFGTAALFVSYLLSFTHFPPACLEGQTTSVHLAAAIGAATLFAGITTLLFRFNKTILTGAICLYMGLLFIWSQVEQDGYVTLWRERQTFWTRVIDICPDLKDGTLIICDNQLPQPNNLMPVNCWSDSVVLEQALQFPPQYTQNPQVSCFPADATLHGWRTWLKRDGTSHVIWDQPIYGRKQGAELIEGNTILLHMDRTGALTRINGTIDIAGKPFELKSPAARSTPAFPTQRFYRTLTEAER